MMMVAVSLLAQAPSNWLTLNWLVREDIFAGLLENDRARLAKGVETLERVGKYYPEFEVVAWKYSIEAIEAVWAHESQDEIGFRRHYGLALTYLNQLRKLTANGPKHLPEIFEGAVLGVLADRMPEGMRKGAWERAYLAYSKLDELQAAEFEKLPMHMKGESLAGLAVTASRTGREAEVMKALTRIQEGMPKTPYAMVAKKWAEEPESRGKVKLMCISCHEPNRLGNRVERSHAVKP